MAEPIEETYFSWLCNRVLERKTGQYISLLRVLHQYEFTWTPDVLADRHRAAEGLEIRNEFLRGLGLPGNPDWHQTGCSVLEMLVGLCDRCSFQTGHTAQEWLVEIFKNLGLDGYGWVEDRDIPRIHEILDHMMSRQYDRNGKGGMFPLAYSRQDQRLVEIWYQFNEYVSEQQLV